MKLSSEVPKHGILIVAILVFCCWNAIKNVSTNEISKSSDANSYMRMAYHIYHNHTVSAMKSTNPVPTSRREPGYSFYLACMMRFSPKLAAVDFSKLTTPDGGLVLFRYCLTPVTIGLAICAWILTYLITKRYLFSYIAMLLAGFGNSLLMISNSVKRESFMALLVLIVAIFFFLAIKTKSKRHFVFLGISLASLVLTNAIYQYFIFILTIYMLFLFKKGLFQKRQFVTCLLLLLASYSVPVGGWMLRNYSHFDRFYICDRGGYVLAIRAEYNKMTADDFGGAFLWWTPDPMFQKKAAKVMHEKNRWINLHRSNPNGHYSTAKSMKNFMVKGEKFENTAQRDKVYQGRAIKEILKHPFKHLIVTIPLAWRGIFVEYGYILHAPFSILIRSIVLISIAYFASLFFWFIQSFRKQKWELFSITLLCMYLYGMNAFFSHSLPRYNQPLIPVLAVLFSVSLYSFLNRKKDINS